MFKSSLLMIVAAVMIPAAAQAATVSIAPTGGASVGTAGVALGTNGSSRYTRVAGSGAATANYYSVLDFNGASILASTGALTTLSSASLSLYDENAYLSLPTGATQTINVYLASNTTVDALDDGNSPLTYSTTNTADPTNGALGTLSLLGTFTYTSPTAGNTAISPLAITNPAALSLLLSDINAGTDIRLVLTAGSSTTAEVFGGYTGLTTITGIVAISPPSLTVTGSSSAVPEPASLGLIAAGGTMLLARRRRSL